MELQHQVVVLGELSDDVFGEPCLASLRQQVADSEPVLLSCVYAMRVCWRCSIDLSCPVRIEFPFGVLSSNALALPFLGG